MLDVLSNRLGIEFAHRYTTKIMENIYLAAVDPDYSVGKKTAFIVLAKEDWNDAFADGGIPIYEKLIDDGYCLALCEANNDDEVANRFFNYGMLPESVPSALTGKEYDLVVLGGHGEPLRIRFGDGQDESATVTPSDFGRSEKWKKGAWATMVAENADIVLVSCSTGQDPKSRWFRTSEEFQNMMEMFGALFSVEGENRGITVYAPENPSNLVQLKSENGRAAPVWTEGIKGRHLDVK